MSTTGLYPTDEISINYTLEEWSRRIQKLQRTIYGPPSQTPSLHTYDHMRGQYRSPITPGGSNAYLPRSSLHSMPEPKTPGAHRRSLYATSGDYGKEYSKDYDRSYGKDYGKDYGQAYGSEHGRDYDKSYGKDYGRDHGRDRRDYGGEDRSYSRHSHRDDPYRKSSYYDDPYRKDRYHEDPDRSSGSSPDDRRQSHHRSRSRHRSHSRRRRESSRPPSDYEKRSYEDEGYVTERESQASRGTRRQHDSDLGHSYAAPNSTSSRSHRASVYGAPAGAYSDIGSGISRPPSAVAPRGISRPASRSSMQGLYDGPAYPPGDDEHGGRHEAARHHDDKKDRRTRDKHEGRSSSRHHRDSRAFEMTSPVAPYDDDTTYPVPRTRGQSEAGRSSVAGRRTPPEHNDRRRSRPSTVYQPNLDYGLEESLDLGQAFSPRQPPTRPSSVIDPQSFPIDRAISSRASHKSAHSFSATTLTGVYSPVGGPRGTPGDPTAPLPPPYADDNAKRIYFYNKGEPYYGFTNFSPHPVLYDGKEYPTSEHLYQSFKFQDKYPDIAEYIRTCAPYPSAARNEAKKYDSFIRPDWFRVHISKMEETLRLKFSQHPELRAELVSTGDAILIEASDEDSFWGYGHDRKGRNELGRALMRLRDELRNLM